MRVLLAIFVSFLFAAVVNAAPIPKALKKQTSRFDYEGFWEQTSSNINGKEGNVTHGKYWKIEGDYFYYSLKDTEVLNVSNKGPLITPDQSEPEIKLYNQTRCRLEIEGDTLKWVFGNDKTDKLENCEPSPKRIIYSFKRVQK